MVVSNPRCRLRYPPRGLHAPRDDDHTTKPSVSHLDLFFDEAVRGIFGIVLVGEAPLVARENAPRLEHAENFAVHALSALATNKPKETKRVQYSANQRTQYTLVQPMQRGDWIVDNVYR